MATLLFIHWELFFKYLHLFNGCSINTKSIVYVIVESITFDTVFSMLLSLQFCFFKVFLTIFANILGHMNLFFFSFKDFFATQDYSNMFYSSYFNFSRSRSHSRRSRSCSRRSRSHSRRSRSRDRHSSSKHKSHRRSRSRSRSRRRGR